MEVYVDNMLVKSSEIFNYVQDLEEVFDTLQRYQMKLNSTKYAFEVTIKKCFEFLVFQQRIEVNSEKIKTIINMKHLSFKKEIQQLNGRITALSRFISRSAERCLPFFKTLRQAKDFSWSDEYRQSFEDLKRYLISPPLLTKPKVGEILYLYLTTLTEVVSSVLV